MEKCGVFIPYHSHQAIPISIPMKLAWRFPFPWESHGTHGNSQYILISTSPHCLRSTTLAGRWAENWIQSVSWCTSVCIRQAAPTYLAELCSPVSESANCGHLRSAARGDLAVPRSRTTRYGQRCWSNTLELTPIVRDPSLTLTQFCALWRLCYSAEHTKH